MCGINLPQKTRPFEAHIDNVENIKHPGPARVAYIQVFHHTGCLRISDVAAIEVRKNEKAANDWKDAAVELVKSARLKSVLKVPTLRHMRLLSSSETLR